MRTSLPLLTLVMTLAGAAPANAWSPKMHEQIALQSSRLMPQALESLLARHANRLRLGAVAPLRLAEHESLYLHAGGSYGRLDAAVLAQSQRILDLLAGRASMSTVAYEFGVLSHYVAIAENPTHAAADDPREAEWSPAFQRLAEKRMPRFKVVFDGYLAAPLARDDIRGFVSQICDRSRLRYPVLARSYINTDGSVVPNSSFSDRHPVFGVASIAYSRGISDTAKLWLYLWIKSGGDTKGLPFPRGLQSNTILPPNRTERKR